MVKGIRAGVLAGEVMVTGIVVSAPGPRDRVGDGKTTVRPGSTDRFPSMTVVELKE